MTCQDLIKEIRQKINPGDVYKNPGGGTSKILRFTDSSICYLRGNSTIYLKYQDIFDSYSKFKGTQVSSRDLKFFKPAVFDSTARPAGHSCNNTFFFNLMQLLGYAGQLNGTGVRGNPYSITLK